MHQTLPNFYIEKYLNLMQRILIIEWGGGGEGGTDYRTNRR